LQKKGLLKNTIVVMMGDNGFMFGEHGMIDKRSAYEESMRVPLIAFGGGMPGGRVEDEIVANIDIAPTFLALAGATIPAGVKIDGMSYADLLMGRPFNGPWRTSLSYEYYWEYNYPQTPTTFALRGDRYKYIQYHGVWDTEELYDLQADPKEMKNLIGDPKLRPVVRKMRGDLFASLSPEQGRSSVTFTQRMDEGSVFRNRKGAGPGDFPGAGCATEPKATSAMARRPKAGQRRRTEAGPGGPFAEKLQLGGRMIKLYPAPPPFQAETNSRWRQLNASRQLSVSPPATG
jgi:N-acetylglucosamine-6-sulfatase